MKKLLAILLVSTSIVFAQDLTMLTSKDALRTYAVEQSTSVFASISMSLPSDFGNYAIVPIELPSVDGINNTIHQLNLSITVANPNDYLFAWASVNDEEGDQLFWGYKNFKLKLVNGQYVLPSGASNIELEMAAEIPIKIGTGAQSAQINLLDGNGQTVGGYPLRVYNGKVYFPSALAGDKSILAVSTNSNGQVHWNYWNVQSGSKIVPLNLGVPLQSQIDGIVSLSNTDIDLQIPTVNQHGDNVTVEYHATAAQSLKASFRTSEGRSAKSVLIRKSGTTDWARYPVTVVSPNSPKVVIPNLAAGVYYLIPEWNEGDLIVPDEQWYPYYWGTTTTTTTTERG